MKKTLFIISILSIVLNTTCDTFENLDKDLIYIKLENISDEKMENFTLNESDFGTIKSGRKSDYHDLEAFLIQDTYPWTTYECEINGKIFSNKGQHSWCSTGLISLEPGRYNVKVDIQQLSDDVSTLTFEIEE
ncbi:MAG: hypothetical protein AB8G11_24205 [Saprospiraceae bacterium]